MKYKALLKLEYQFPIWLLCEIAGVSRTAYYRYKKKPLKQRDAVEKIIIDLYHKSNKRAGYRSIKDLLWNKYNLVVNHKKVYRIMRENRLSSIVRKKYRVPKETRILKENLLARDFKTDLPGKKYVTDITYIPTRRTMAYLCVVIDLYNREPVIWNISDKQDKHLSLETIKELSKAVNLKGSVVHSDQGVHFTNTAYVELLETLEAEQSMSRKGNCWDIAPAESFFGHFKSETIHLRSKKLEDLNEARQITEEYMDYYINERPQRAHGRLPPSLYGAV